MPSESDFLNDALSQIGATVITAMDDGTPNANHCARLYPALRAAALRLHTWNFARDRAYLAQNVIPPAFEFAFSYALPGNFIRVLEYNGTNVDTTTTALNYDSYFSDKMYKIEGKNLFTNDGTVALKYIKDITNPNLWDPLFYQMLASWLASKLAMAITKDNAKSKELLTQAISFGLPMAAAVDSQEGGITPYTAPDLIWGR